jgi:hypothetical protein
VSDEIPSAARVLPLKAEVVVAHRIGEKCVVTQLSDGWICAHGTTGEGRDERVGIPAEHLIAPAGSIGVDKSQARVYFRVGDEEAEARALVITPDNLPFRSSAKGRTEERSKSFDKDGSPAPPVLLLYALKTGRYDDRVRALETLPLGYWHDEVERSQVRTGAYGPNLGQIFDAMDFAALTPGAFKEIVGRRIAAAAGTRSGLSDWSLWDCVAEEAKQRFEEQRQNDTIDSSQDTDAPWVMEF